MSYLGGTSTLSIGINAGAALEHSCQQEEADLEARRKRQQDLAEEIERQSEKQQQDGDDDQQFHECEAAA